MNIGIIGTGAIGTAHAMGINCLDDDLVHLRACCDLNKEVLQKFCEEYGGTAFNNIDKMLEDEGLDAVIVCLPHGLHCEVGIKVLESGKHLLVEKPMAPTVEECQLLIDTAKRCDRKLQVGHEYYLYPAIREARKVLDAGEIGPPLMIKSEIYSYIYNLLGTWWMDPEKAKGGPAINMAVHVVDITSFLLGRNPLAVRGESRELHSEAIAGIEDYFRMELDFGNNLFADCRTYSFVRPCDKLKAAVTVFAEKGCLSVWSNALEVQVGEAKSELRYEGDMSKGYLLFAEQAKQFVEYIEHDIKPRSDGEFGKMTVTCIEEAIKSGYATTDNWVKIS